MPGLLLLLQVREVCRAEMAAQIGGDPDDRLDGRQDTGDLTRPAYQPT